MAIQLIVGQSVTHNRIFLRKCARWSSPLALCSDATTLSPWEAVLASVTTAGGDTFDSPLVKHLVAAQLRRVMALVPGASGAAWCIG